MMISKKTTQRNAGYKSAHTKTINKLDSDVAKGLMAVATAAGFKAAATRKLKKQLSSS